MLFFYLIMASVTYGYCVAEMRGQPFWKTVLMCMFTAIVWPAFLVWSLLDEVKG